MKKMTVIGDGGWGTALAMVLQKNGFDVCVWGPFPQYLNEIRATHENRKFLPGVALPEAVSWTADRAEAVRDASLVVVAAPSHYFKPVLSSFAGLIAPETPLVSVTKGFDEESGRLMTDLAREILDRPSVAALSGPSHAEEVAREVPTAVVLASTLPEEQVRLQEMFTSGVFRVYTSDDVLGVQLGGAVKNVIAIAVGACDGLGFGDNTKAALMTRGLAEITRLGMAMGARLDTFAGLSGMGDLIVTCGSRHSRNRSVGERLGRGESIEQIRAGMEQVAEGVWNCVPARMLARKYGVEMPITEAVYALIYEGKSCMQAVQELLERTPKPESI
ncbi:MAG: NAD(P)-dependent glycerol-3-phosphate dehydrogenase [Kiritimatiellae bacterium]|nr:NAD(P)-dependent glycerol-3-phosphate dehydrogenase [Kiritimatiellia bacterium]